VYDSLAVAGAAVGEGRVGEAAGEVRWWAAGGRVRFVFGTALDTALVVVEGAAPAPGPTP
jgi:hypothetical protein